MSRRSSLRPFVLLLLLPGAIWSSSVAPVLAQPQPSLPLTPQQRQHIQSDLIPSRSQDFFRRGDRILEMEIRRLRKAAEPAPPLLKIEPLPSPNYQENEIEIPAR